MRGILKRRGMLRMLDLQKLRKKMMKIAVIFSKIFEI